MTLRSRTRLCIALIVLGLTNFISYTVVYAYINGDAANGRIENHHYYVGGHYIHGREGRMTEVSRWVWIYSYIHSISIWPTAACVLLSAMVLARPLIIATYTDGLIRGPTLVTILITLITLVTGVVTIYFTIDFIRVMRNVH